MVQTLFKDYAGVLISDFYAGYDAFDCRQQKCLVHLIRDLNDDLWKNPFNQEFESFVASVKDLFVPYGSFCLGRKTWTDSRTVNVKLPQDRFYQ